MSTGYAGVKVSEIREMNLPCVLTDAEVIERADKMAAQIVEGSRLEDEKKATAARFKEEIEGIEKSHAKLGREVRERTTWRDVDVRDEFRFAKDEVVTIRLDTGAVIETRKMKDIERQELLPLTEDAEGRTATAQELAEGKGRVN